MKRRTLAIVATVCTLAGIFVWMLFRADTPDPPTPNAASQSAPTHVLLQMAQPQGEPVGPAADEIELCGYGRIRIGHSDLPATIKADAKVALERAATELSASGADSDRALGLKLRMYAAVQVVDDETRQDRQCWETPACAAKANAAYSRAAAPWAESLAKLALTTRSEKAYALAIGTCRKASLSKLAPACSSLSSERWAQLDPQNAAPWLWTMEDARSNKDAAALDYAAYRVSASRTVDFGDAFYRVLKLQAVQEQPRYTQIVIALDLIGITAAMPMPYGPAVSYCSREAIADSARLKRCDEIATMFVSYDKTMMGRSIGIAIGERAGWPSQQIAALTEEKDAMHAAAPNPPMHQMLSCTGFEQAFKWWDSVAVNGEVGAARQWMKASGRSTSELAQERRQRLAERISENANAARSEEKMSVQSGVPTAR